MSHKENPGSGSIQKLWQPIKVYNTLKAWFFKVFPKESKTYRAIRNSLSVFLKQLNIINLYYRKWLQEFDSPSIEDFEQIKSAIKTEHLTQPFSIVMPVYNPPEKMLQEALESVVNQVYPHWELCIADDASTDHRIPALLQTYADRDERIKVIFREENGHISAASNSALSLASHAFIVLLDHDDILHPCALYHVAKALKAQPECVIIYSDEDKITKRGRRLDPYFKPDFDYDLLLSQNMISHLGVYRTDVVREVGGFRIGLEGSQDYDLALRVMDRCSPGQIHHIARPLYHWRLFKQSAAKGLDVKPYTVQAAVKALQDHLSRRGVEAEVRFLPEVSSYAVSYTLPQDQPEVGILVFAKQLSPNVTQTIESILDNTAYEPIHLYIDLDPSHPSQPILPARWKTRVTILTPNPANQDHFSRRANQAIRQLSEEVICLMPGALSGFKPGWLPPMIGQLLQEGVGAVAPRFLFSDGRVCSNGLILLPDASVGHLSQGKEHSDNGYFGWSKISRGFSALPAECILFRKDSFTAVNGFTEELQTPLGSITDLCLKFRQGGLRNVLLPAVNLLIDPENYCNAKVWKLDEAQEIQNQVFPCWEPWFRNDPAFNPNLTLIEDGQITINLSSEEPLTEK